MSILSMSSGLFLILGIYIRVLADRLTERNFWCLQSDSDFVTLCQLACCHFQMLVTHSINQWLAVLTVIYHFQCHILCHHLRKSLWYLVLITFVIHYILHICIRFGVFGSSIRYRCIFCWKGIPCLCTCQFCNRSDITCKQFLNFYRFVAG